MTHRNNINQSGFTLIEILIALAIFSIAILAIVGLQATVIKGNIGSRSITSAIFLAESRLEAFRAAGFTSLTNGTDINDPNNPLDSEGQAGGIFNRSWTITDYTIPNTKRITVTITWNDQVAQNRSISLDTVLSSQID